MVGVKNLPRNGRKARRGRIGPTRLKTATSGVTGRRSNIRASTPLRSTCPKEYDRAKFIIETPRTSKCW
jgi:hypothetical protein